MKTRGMQEGQFAAEGVERVCMCLAQGGAVPQGHARSQKQEASRMEARLWSCLAQGRGRLLGRDVAIDPAGPWA
jgi:hypothetical protein